MTLCHNDNWDNQPACRLIALIYIYMRGISVQTVHDPKMSKISKFRGWPWDGYSVVEDA